VNRRRRPLVALAAVALLALVACSEPIPKDATAPTSTLPGTDGCAHESSVLACAPKGTMLEPYLPAKPTKATGTPIRIGTINQDTGAAGAFPELTLADRTAIDFINNELGGVDGRPIELVACNTQFSPDLSQACAQQMVAEQVDAVVGGIDVWGTGITTLENNGIPWVGGIPVSFQSARSPVSFQFSGGIWGAVLGHGEYALRKYHAKRIAIIAADFGPITDAAKLGQQALEQRGVKTTLISVSPINADMVQALNTAVASNPDAIIALTADSGCKPAMVTAQQLGLKVPMMYTGACAAPKIVQSVNGAADGAIFNLEADLDPTNPDNVMYRLIASRYGPKYGYESQSAGTVSFRSMMNLYAVLRTIGGDRITRGRILEAFRDGRDHPSFFGHPYTCDGHQLDGYPAICSPQQTLGRLGPNSVTALTGWIDVGAFARGTSGTTGTSGNSGK
jgi:branched-chain amino acid transport system substrate-binding protein